MADTRRIQISVPESIADQWEERRAASGIPHLSTWVVTQVQRPDTAESLSLILERIGQALELIPEEEHWMVETLRQSYSSQADGAPVTFQEALRIAVRQAYGQVRPNVQAVRDVLVPSDSPDLA